MSSNNQLQPPRDDQIRDQGVTFQRKTRNGFLRPVTRKSAPLKCTFPTQNGELCGSETETPSKMRIHLLKEHAKGRVRRIYQCSNCLGGYTRESSLLRHIGFQKGGTCPDPTQLPEDDPEYASMEELRQALFPLATQSEVDKAVGEIEDRNAQCDLVSPFWSDEDPRLIKIIVQADHISRHANTGSGENLLPLEHHTSRASSFTSLDEPEPLAESTEAPFQPSHVHSRAEETPPEVEHDGYIDPRLLTTLEWDNLNRKYYGVGDGQGPGPSTG